jgi:hypothetical protein
MADTNQPDTNRITPRDVEPDSKKSGGGVAPDRSTGHDRGVRREPVVEEADGGDIGGVAGGGIDRGVSGLGGDANPR